MQTIPVLFYFPFPSQPTLGLSGKFNTDATQFRPLLVRPLAAKLKVPIIVCWFLCAGFLLQEVVVHPCSDTLLPLSLPSS